MSLLTGIYTLDGFELIGNNQETNSEFPIFSENTDFDLSDSKEESNKSSSFTFQQFTMLLGQVEV